MRRGDASHALTNRFGLQGITRTIVIIGVLLLAWQFGQTPSTTYFLLPIVLAVVFLLLKYPIIGLIGIIVSALVAPGGIGTGTQTNLPYAFIGVPVLWVVWLLRTFYYRMELPRIHWGVALPLGGLVITTLVSWVSGYLPWNPFAEDMAPLRAQAGAAAVIIFSVGLFLLVAGQVDNVKQLQALMFVFLAIGGVYVVGRAFGMSIFSRLVIQEATGSMFWLWLVSLALGQVLYNTDMKWYWRFMLLVLAGTSVYVSIAQAADWASGWVVMLISVAVMLFLRWPRLGLVGIPIGMVVVALNFQPFSDALLSGDNAYSLLTRRAALEIMLKVIEVNPFLGVGPANYYYYTPLYSILGWYVRFNSHNQYIDILAQVGIIGLGFIAWFFTAAGVLCLKMNSRTTGDPFVLSYAAACLAGLVGTLASGMLGDWFLPFVYNVGVSGFRASMLPWIFLGGLAALYRLNSLSEASLETSTTDLLVGNPVVNSSRTTVNSITTDKIA